jgi:hypothetical protein
MWSIHQISLSIQPITLEPLKDITINECNKFISKQFHTIFSYNIYITISINNLLDQSSNIFIFVLTIYINSHVHRTFLVFFFKFISLLFFLHFDLLFSRESQDFLFFFH